MYNGDYVYISHGFSTVRYSNTFRADIRGTSGNLKWDEQFSGTNEYNPNAPHARCLVGTAQISNTNFVMAGGCLHKGGTGGPCPGIDGMLLFVFFMFWNVPIN